MSFRAASWDPLCLYSLALSQWLWLWWWWGFMVDRIKLANINFSFNFHWPFINFSLRFHLCIVYGDDEFREFVELSLQTSAFSGVTFRPTGHFRNLLFINCLSTFIDFSLNFSFQFFVIDFLSSFYSIVSHFGSKLPLQKYF